MCQTRKGQKMHVLVRVCTAVIKHREPKASWGEWFIPLLTPLILYHCGKSGNNSRTWNLQEPGGRSRCRGMDECCLLACCSWLALAPFFQLSGEASSGVALTTVIWTLHLNCQSRKSTTGFPVSQSGRGLFPSEGTSSTRIQTFVKVAQNQPAQCSFEQVFTQMQNISFKNNVERKHPIPGVSWTCRSQAGARS